MGGGQTGGVPMKKPGSSEPGLRKDNRWPGPGRAQSWLALSVVVVPELEVVVAVVAVEELA